MPDVRLLQLLRGEVEDEDELMKAASGLRIFVAQKLFSEMS